MVTQESNIWANFEGSIRRYFVAVKEYDYDPQALDAARAKRKENAESDFNRGKCGFGKRKYFENATNCVTCSALEEFLKALRSGIWKGIKENARCGKEPPERCKALDLCPAIRSLRKNKDIRLNYADKSKRWVVSNANGFDVKIKETLTQSNFVKVDSDRIMKQSTKSKFCE